MWSCSATSGGGAAGCELPSPNAIECGTRPPLRRRRAVAESGVDERGAPPARPEGVGRSACFAAVHRRRLTALNACSLAVFGNGVRQPRQRQCRGAGALPSDESQPPARRPRRAIRAAARVDARRCAAGRDGGFEARGRPEASLSAEHLSRARRASARRAPARPQLNSPLDEDARAFAEMRAPRLERRAGCSTSSATGSRARAHAGGAAPVLIPPPETEELVELPLRRARRGRRRARGHLPRRGAVAAAPSASRCCARCRRRATWASTCGCRACGRSRARERRRARPRRAVRGGAPRHRRARSRINGARRRRRVEPAVHPRRRHAGARAGGARPGRRRAVRRRRRPRRDPSAANGAAPSLLRADGPRAVWLEVDASHPPLIDAWLARRRRRRSRCASRAGSATPAATRAFAR